MASASIPATCSEESSGKVEDCADQPTNTQKSTAMESVEEMEELRRVQLACEGMKLLLCSRLKEAEELFEKSR